MSGLFSPPKVKVEEPPKPITRDETMLTLEDRLRLTRRRGRSGNIFSTRRDATRGTTSTAPSTVGSGFKAPSFGGGSIFSGGPLP